MAEGSWGSEGHTDITQEDAEFGVCPAGFSLVLVQYFFTVLPSLPFRMVMYILCHHMLEACNRQSTFKILACVSGEIWDLGLLHRVETDRVGLNAFLPYDMTTSLCGRGDMSWSGM